MAMDKIIQQNKEAFQQAAEIELGKSGITIVKETLKKAKVLPPMMSGYLDTSIGEIAIANLIGTLAENFPQQKKLQVMSKASKVAAYQTVFASFDIQGMVNKLINSPKLAKFTNLSTEVVVEEEE
jgi:hypothetical protein